MGEIRNRRQLVYLLAASHSGSTLTAMLLNAHPDICTVGELKISSLDSQTLYRCSCRILIHECHFWRDVSLQMAEQNLDFDVRDAQTDLLPTRSAYVNRLIRPLHRGPILEFGRDGFLSLSRIWRQSRAIWAVRNKALIESIGIVSGARYVVDSSKTAVRLKYLRRISGLDVKVIRIIRDGRAVALTYMDSDNFADAKDLVHRGGGTGPTSRPRLDMVAAATRWLRSNRDAEAVLKTIPSSSLLNISYEELCIDVEQTFRKIYAFLDLEYSDKFRDFRSVSHHVVGNGMRLDRSSIVVLDERWRQVLTAQDLFEFEAVAGRLNSSYGYS